MRYDECFVCVSAWEVEEGRRRINVLLAYSLRMPDSLFLVWVRFHGASSGSYGIGPCTGRSEVDSSAWSSSGGDCWSSLGGFVTAAAGTVGAASLGGLWEGDALLLPLLQKNQFTK